MGIVDAARVAVLMQDPAFDWVCLKNGIFFYRIDEHQNLRALYKVSPQDSREVIDMLQKE